MWWCRLVSVSYQWLTHEWFKFDLGFMLASFMSYKSTVYPKKYAHSFCFAVLCCGYTLTDFPISIRLTSLALWQSNDCPSASKATLMNMDKYFMWIHYERLHNHNKAKHNKTVCIFLGIYWLYMFIPRTGKKLQISHDTYSVDNAFTMVYHSDHSDMILTNVLVTI